MCSDHYLQSPSLAIAKQMAVILQTESLAIKTSDIRYITGKEFLVRNKFRMWPAHIVPNPGRDNFQDKESLTSYSQQPTGAHYYVLFM